MNFNLDLMVPYEKEVKAAIESVIDRKQFILGDQGRTFEEHFASMMGQRHAVGVGNGTDALRIAMLALGIKPGDEVISPAFNVAYTALAVAAIGAVNVFVECYPDTLLIDLDAVEAAITPKTRAIVPVHIFGQMCNMERVSAIANTYGLMVVEDAAQAHGALYEGYRPGHFADATAYSFYPTKNLGALGEAGAITTNLDIVAERARLLRDGGRTDRYLHVLPGINSCLDEIQAAVLQVKLPWLSWRNQQRRVAARYYRNALAGLEGNLTPLSELYEALHVYHLFVVRAQRRDKLYEFLKTRGIPTLVHYPVPVPYQPCFMTALPGGLWPEAEKAAREVLSLPMHPDITTQEMDLVVSGIKEFYGQA